MKQLDKINELKNQYEAACNEIGQELFVELFEPIWDKYPTLESFSFTAYTPYFNDGETCVYGVNNDEYTINLTFKNGNTYNMDESYDECPIMKDIVKLSNQVPEDVYQRVCGDHVLITFTRDGMETEEYEHD